MTLADLYKRVPHIACKGLCRDACGPIVVGAKEAAAMRAAAGGAPLTVVADTATCGYLKDGRCTVYAQRPLICRLYGVVAGMRCEWGCEADRILPDAEARVLIRTLERIGGRRVVSAVVDAE